MNTAPALRGGAQQTTTAPALRGGARRHEHMTQDQNKKTLRHFQCRDYLWEIFEQMSAELECSTDYLINEAMRQYARSRNYGTRQGASASGGFPRQSAPTPAPPMPAPAPGIAAAPAPS